MIITFIFGLLTTVSYYFFGWLPTVTTLPLGLDSALTTAIGSFYSIKEIIPPLDILWTAFLWYFGFKMTLWVLKTFRILPS